MTNKSKGILWIISPISFLIFWFILFGIVTVITSVYGGEATIMKAIFPIITGLTIILIPIGIILGITKFNKDKKHNLNSVEVRYCNECGNKTSKDSQFCTQCGKKVNL